MYVHREEWKWNARWNRRIHPECWYSHLFIASQNVFWDHQQAKLCSSRQKLSKWRRMRRHSGVAVFNQEKLFLDRFVGANGWWPAKVPLINTHLLYSAISAILGKYWVLSILALLKRASTKWPSSTQTTEYILRVGTRSSTRVAVPGMYAP